MLLKAYYASRNNSAVFYPEYYVKIKQKIDANNLKKEVVDSNGNLSYEHAPPSYYHPDFLTGTTAKIFRYDEPHLYQKLFKHFEENLQRAEKLVIIGYGGRDERVNEIITEHFDHQNKSSYIIDPYAGKAIKELAEKLGATLLPSDKTVETITVDDLS